MPAVAGVSRSGWEDAAARRHRWRRCQQWLADRGGAQRGQGGQADDEALAVAGPRGVEGTAAVALHPRPVAAQRGGWRTVSERAARMVPLPPRAGSGATTPRDRVVVPLRGRGSRDDHLPSGGDAAALPSRVGGARGVGGIGRRSGFVVAHLRVGFEVGGGGGARAGCRRVAGGGGCRAVAVRVAEGRHAVGALPLSRMIRGVARGGGASSPRGGVVVRLVDTRRGAGEAGG